jgi:hypothetical protein
MTGIDLAKDVDKTYFYVKMSGLVEDVNAWVRNADLSSDGITRSIGSHISGALNDDRVMNGIVGTMNMRKYMEDVEWTRRNKPEQYSAINEAFGMAPFVGWLNDGQAGSKPVQSRYTPYMDVSGDMDKWILDIQKAKANGQKMDIPDLEHPGYMKKISVDKLTEPEIHAIIKGRLSPAHLQQLEIEAWYNYESNPSVYGPEGVKAYAERQASVYDTAINSLEAQKANAGSDENTRKQYDAQIANLTQEKERFKLSIQEFTGGKGFDPRRAAQFITMQNLLEDKGRQWSYDKTSVEYSKDDAFFARATHNLAVSKHEFDMKKNEAGQYETMRHHMVQEKLAENEYQLKLLKEFGADPSSGAGGEGQKYGPGTVITEGTTITESKDIRKRYRNYMENGVATFDASMEMLVNSFTPGVKQSLNNYIAQEKANPMNAGRSDNEILYDYFADGAGANNDYIKNNPSAVAALGTAMSIKERTDAIVNDFAKDTVSSFEKNILDDLGQRRELRDNINKILKKGEEVSIYDIDRGERRIYKATDGPLSESDTNKIQANMLMDKFFKNIKVNKDGSISDIDPEDIALLQLAGRRFGEEVGINDLFDIKDGQYKLAAGQSDDSARNRNKTLRLMKGVMSQKIPFFLIGIPDRTAMRGTDVEAYRVIDSEFDKARDAAYDRYFADGNVAYNDLTVDEKSSMYRPLTMIYEHAFSEKYGGVLGKSDIGKGSIRVSMGSEPNTRKLTRVGTDMAVEVPMTDLSKNGMPVFIHDRQMLGYDYVPQPKTNISYAERGSAVASMYPGEQNRIVSDYVLNDLSGMYANILDPMGQNAEAASGKRWNIVSNAIEHSDRFILAAKPNPAMEGYNIELYVKSASGGDSQLVHTHFARMKSWEQVQDSWHLMPEGFLTDVLMNILNEETEVVSMRGAENMSRPMRTLGRALGVLPD